MQKPNRIAQVIRILDEYSLIIDAGKEVLSAGDKIQVYEPGDMIKDLNGNSLGYYIRIKDNLEVIQVEDSYAICRKNKTVPAKASAPLAISPLLESKFLEKEPLPVNIAEIEPIGSGDEMIHVGDAVKLANFS